MVIKFYFLINEANLGSLQNKEKRQHLPNLGTMWSWELCEKIIPFFTFHPLGLYLGSWIFVYKLLLSQKNENANKKLEGASPDLTNKSILISGEHFVL